MMDLEIVRGTSEPDSQEEEVVEQEEKLKLLDITKQEQEEPYKQVEGEYSLLIPNDCVY